MVKGYKTLSVAFFGFILSFSAFRLPLTSKSFFLLNFVFGLASIGSMLIDIFNATAFNLAPIAATAEEVGLLKVVLEPLSSSFVSRGLGLGGLGLGDPELGGCLVASVVLV